MNRVRLSIGNQLFIGFSAIIIAIVFLGFLSYKQSVLLFEETDKLYHHPLIVRRAVSDVENGIAKMRLSMRDLMLSKNEKEFQSALYQTQNAEQTVERNFKLIYDAYLGPKSDIDTAYDAFKVWSNIRQKNIQLAAEGKIETVKANVANEGEVGNLREEMIAKIQIISEYSKNKASEFYLNSQQIVSDLFANLIIICSLIIAFIITVGFYLVRKIRSPLKELADVVSAYRSGKLDVRSTNNSTDEIGTLAVAFNDLLEHVKEDNIISDKITRIADAMLVEDNAHQFFQNLLPVLASETNSQIATIYILDESRTEFYLYESLGLNPESEKHRFSAKSFEGEFGAVLATKKIQFIRSIPKDTLFTFNTVSGSMVPREIVTIPILAGNEVVAIVSVAGVRKYSAETTNLFYKIYDVLSARIDGILAYRNIRKSAARLQEQNLVLEQQRNELNQQATELSQQNAELEIQKNQLKEASQLKTTFLSNMSHELRTPLNSVIALSGVLNRKLANKIPDDEYSYIGVIERNGRHLLTLINDILDISRIESGREEIEINEFDVNDVIAEVIEMIQPQANERKIKLLQHKSEQPILLQSDNKKVRHILLNLIANAVKFTEKGAVEVRITTANNTVSIHVKDTGIGIAANDLNHIFNEFRQADSGTSRRFGGTGLGLSIARKYARMLGGNVTVESELGVGSEFTLLLPEKKGAHIEIKDIDRTYDLKVPLKYHKIKPINEPKTILLVEDSEAAIVQIKDMLESNNYKVHAAHSGAEALEFLTKFNPDAIILDLMMPQMDGFELLEKIRNFDRTKDVPVLILTAKHITKDDIKFLKNNNVHELIQKGDVQKDALLQSIYAMVAKPEPDHKVDNPQPMAVNWKPENEKSKLTVLIVEDNMDNMTTVKAVIGEKFSVIEAYNGIQGVEMAQKYLPDLILMDIALPELDGIQAFKQIRNNPRLVKIPIVALTASAMLSERETILAYGFEAYIAKPIDETQFFETINTVMYGK